MVEKIDDAQRAWLRGLKGAERQAMRERAAFLDRLSATGTPSGPQRIALLVGLSGEWLQEMVVLSYELANADQIVWLYSPGPLPGSVPPDFHARVCHINQDQSLPLVNQMPPADVVLTSDPGLLVEFYKAGRSLLYWHHHGATLPEGYTSLPARILTPGMAGTTLDGRRVFPVAPGPAGWGIALAAAQEVAAKDPVQARRPRLSLCMIVKNEEKHLQNCLLSVYGVVDEICVVDTGSSDRTVQIAQRLGAKVEHREWRDDFAWARNEALAMATGEWILHLDADEFLTSELRSELPKLIRRSDAAGFLVLIESVIPGGTSSSYALRLFKKDPQTVYTGIIHENVGASIARRGGVVAPATGKIRHLGYAEHAMSATGKRSRNLNLLRKALIAEPESNWYRYYLAVEEHLIGNPAEALRLLEDIPLNKAWIEGEPAMLGIHVYRSMGEERRALQLAQQATKAYPLVSRLWIVQAQIAYGLGEEAPLQDALAWMATERADRLGDPDMLAQHRNYLLGCLATDPEQKERHLLKVLPSPMGARALMRHWVRAEGPAEAFRRTEALELPDRYELLLQALADLQDWSHLQALLEMQPELKRTAVAGSLYLAQGRAEMALSCWQNSGAEGWYRYAIVVAMLGGKQLLAAAEPHLNPLQWLAVQDVAQNQVTWRWATITAGLCNINNPNLLEQLLARAPFLSDSVVTNMRLNVLS